MTKHLIMEGIVQSHAAAIKLKEQQLSEQWNSSLLQELMLAEKSSLNKVIGDGPGGQYLLKWMHIHHRLSSSASYRPVTKGATSRVYWSQFKTDPDHFLIVTTNTSAIGIKPNTDSFNANRAEAEAQGKEYNPSVDTKLYYDVVGFRMKDRIDNLLIPMPTKEDFTDRKGNFDQGAFEQAVEDVKAQRARALNPSAPPTKILSKRGGGPFHRDPVDNIMDRIKETGGITGVYVVSGTDTDDPIASRKELKGIKAQKVHSAELGKPVPGGEEEWPRASGIEQGKLARRAPAQPRISDEMDRLARRLLPILPKIVAQADRIIDGRIRQMPGAGDTPAEKKLASHKRLLASFKASMADPTGSFKNQVIAKAASNAYNVDINSPQGATVISKVAQGPTSELEPLIAELRNLLTRLDARALM